MKKRLDDLLFSFQEEWNFLRSIKVEKYSVFLFFIFLLSILDAIFTLVWIKTGLALEANPLLKNLLKEGDFSFMSTKIVLTLLGCLFLYRTKDTHKLARASIVFLLISYTVLTLYHIVGALQSIDPSNLPDFVNDVLIMLS